MVTSSSDTKAPSSPPMSSNGSSGDGGAGGLESPPSYDYATSLPLDLAYSGGGGSSSAAAPAPELRGASGSAIGGPDRRGPPKHIEHLFSGPPNAEQLLGRNSAPLERVANIATHKKWRRNVTFDPALQDPDTLYDWIRYQTLQVPHVKLKIQGAHMETPQRTETVHDSNGTRTRQKGQPERIIDFDFWIDLTPVLDHTENQANIHLRSVPPSATAYRGTHVLHYGAQYRAPDQSPFPSSQGYAPLLPSGEYSSTDVGGRADRNDDGFKKEEGGKWLWSKGLPQWTDLRNNQEFWADRAAGKKGKRSRAAPIALPNTSPTSSPTRARDEEGNGAGWDEEAAVENIMEDRISKEQALRAWCLKYCQDNGLLKSFQLSKWMWGWETAALETAVRGAILSTGYQSNDISVVWDVGDYSLDVRPPNVFSRAVWDTPWWLMPIILLLYPFIWLWQRAHTLGGAPYAVARASYAFKFYPSLPSTFPNETLEAAQDRLPSLYKLHPELPKSPILQPGPKGIHYLLGRKEGEWFREWEERIRMGVRMRYKGELQDTRVGEHEAPILDGY